MGGFIPKAAGLRAGDPIHYSLVEVGGGSVCVHLLRVLWTNRSEGVLGKTLESDEQVHGGATLSLYRAQYQQSDTMRFKHYATTSHFTTGESTKKTLKPTSTIHHSPWSAIDNKSEEDRIRY